MQLPDPVLALSQLPGAILGRTWDRSGNPHLCALAGGQSVDRGAAEYGVPGFSGDTMYVAAPFDPPPGKVSVEFGGASAKRRVLGFTVVPSVFVVVQLGDAQ